MALSSDFFERLQELLESAEEAYVTGNYEDAAEYIEEIRSRAANGLEELEEVDFPEELEEPEE